ncbi:WDGH domain-containing protein [Oceanobacillus neutriphilus]|uniref:WDGH domain-containing protein n=1 Tax=Oceanobacillus neutriphilus TaxID=531815 RepID=A0ABQ2NPI2_9BACI|nr:hypothetical protein [Oceanobacillus neutriphilus]GGP07293.1 hypothetical protein GCM10011346_02700 [Oceanobacillus neutriphilus]
MKLETNSGMTRTEFINNYIACNKSQVNTDKVSDTYHTFEELYYHRMVLFSIICKQSNERAWKSWQHDDGTMFDGYFIVGVETVEGHYTYHYHEKYWEMFDVQELERAPEYDGHKPEDISRLLTLK